MTGGLSNSSGVSAEVFVPSTGQHCQLADMAGHQRDSHVMREMTVCGGGDTETSRSCTTLKDGDWEVTAELLESRQGTMRRTYQALSCHNVPFVMLSGGFIRSGPLRQD